MVVESARPAVSTSTETKKLAGSPADSPGIGLPAGTLTDSIVVVRPPVEAAAIRATQSPEVLAGVACARAICESAAMAITPSIVGNLIGYLVLRDLLTRESVDLRSPVHNDAECLRVFL